jgi:hypothetical protein
MHVNVKMSHVETIPGMEERGIKESGRREESKYDIFDTLQEFCKCHIYSHPEKH